MKHCPSCRSEITLGQRFCGHCGTSLELDSSSSAPTRVRPEGAAAAPTATEAKPPTPSRLPSLSSSVPPGDARFLPGTVLADRYRIVALIGKGGMGEVYRADDLKLGQTVALKFLPESLSGDESRLARLFNEVRTARQVTHANVCRVYDLGEVDGHHYISMEYVDGEDLATLLRRIDRLPKDKAIQTARQLCAGLAAAHEEGILHRDLKPANVMIDGRGRVRITDFGLAGLAKDIGGDDFRAGTPTYMAPEQLAGREVSVRSDIYSLGLVLYELFTGKQAFKAETLGELMRLQQDTTPMSPSIVIDGFDPAVERVILRCIEKEPRDRPASALAVAAALPGGDPLAAALAAGETPSPEMVADAGPEGALRPAVAVPLLLFVLGGLLTCAFLLGRHNLLAKAAPAKPPGVLADNARNILAGLGWTDPPADTAFDFHTYRDFIDYLEREDSSPDRWNRLETDRPGAIVFRYRESPRHMVPVNDNSRVLESDPPMRISGEARMQLDGQGRLLRLLVIPPHRDESPPPGEEPEWAGLLAAAGLDPSGLERSDPQWVPEAYCDTRAAWTGTYPEQAEPEIRVEACVYRGRPVFFAIYHPWDRPWRMEVSEQTSGERVQQIFWGGLFLAVLFGSFLLARRNLKQGRGDRRGAFRLAMFIFSLIMLGWIFLAAHVPEMNQEINMFFRSIGTGLLVAVFVWLMYIALEPFVRRRWPKALVSWNRVLAGRFRDPLVGRDILMGAAVGVGIGLWFWADNLARNLLGLLPEMPDTLDLDLLLGTRWMIGSLFWSLFNIIFVSTFFLFILTLVTVLLRNRWFALGVLVITFSVINSFQAEYFWINVAMGLVLWGSLFVTLFRFGLVAAISLWFFGFTVIDTFPLTLDFTVWYSGNAIISLVVAAAVAIFGFFTSLAGRPVFQDLLGQE